MARINRAQFASHCQLCDETVWPGEEIVFDQATQSWVHVECTDDENHPTRNRRKEEPQDITDADLFYEPDADHSAFIDELNLTDL